MHIFILPSEGSQHIPGRGFLLATWNAQPRSFLILKFEKHPKYMKNTNSMKEKNQEKEIE